MLINEKSVRYHLKSGDLVSLFREDLGWNRYRTPLTIIVEGQTFRLASIAERNGMVALQCEPQGDGNIPEYKLRRKIEQEVTKQVQEHLIVFVDGAGQQQVWQWVKRDPGKPAAYREHAFDTRHQSGETLVQRLRNIAFDLEEEEFLTLPMVTGRARAGFDVEKVTKKFYELFKKQHADFLQSVDGIDPPDDRAWYTSVMLNRLMFVYFIQKKRFLDDDDQYLRNRLKRVQAAKGSGHFHDFYRCFLLRLFHEGLGEKSEDRSPERNAELEALLGKVPYLNGGIFAPHSLEDRYKGIQIEDAAFERIFDFFDQYHWHLDERPLKDDREINPDVLGYIFEKYINQKEMGAYYTKEDITEYIGRSTILPYLFDAAQPECAIAFREDGSVWRLLREDPGRYLFDAVKKGVEIPLPANIEAGAADVANRGDWNRPAPEEFALPTEIWREVVARRQRYADVRAKLAGGEIHSINDFITYNLDIRQFAQDVIEQCEGPELLRAFWKMLQSMRVLDPTVGSGAFLFAALNILEPLYEAVLERMESFVGDADRADPARTGTKFSDFRQVLKRIDEHPNRRHYIYKSIIVNNLFGVDIMEEATEICKLRLFLKLVAQVETVTDLEPLPDIDFNIRAGNTLVGYAQIDDIDRLWTATGRLAFERDREKLEMLAGEYALLLKDFRDQQLGLPTPKTVTKKDVERAANEELRPELDKDLWRLYRTAGKVNDKMTLAQFRASHGPLHWFVEFPEVMAHGGFDVIIGNPPWREYAATKNAYSVIGYVTEACGNLYALCTERIIAIQSSLGRVSFIVQLPITSSSRMDSLRSILRRSDVLHVISFDDRPGKLFEGLEHSRSAIFLSKGSPTTKTVTLYTTRYQRWYSNTRDVLTQLLFYTPNTVRGVHASQFPKCADVLQDSIFSNVVAKSNETLGRFVSPRPTDHFVFYQEATQYWVKATYGLPYYAKNGTVGAPAHGRYLYFSSAQVATAACGLLNSSLFYLYFIAYGDCFHLSQGLATTFPVAGTILLDVTLAEASSRLMVDLRATAERKTICTRGGDVIAYDEYYGSKNKPLINEIDRVLARHYGFTDEELDFIMNYDIKYRMGRGGEDDGDE